MTDHSLFRRTSRSPDGPVTAIPRPGRCAGGRPLPTANPVVRQHVTPHCWQPAPRQSEKRHARHAFHNQALTASHGSCPTARSAGDRLRRPGTAHLLGSKSIGYRPGRLPALSNEGLPLNSASAWTNHLVRPIGIVRPVATRPSPARCTTGTGPAGQAGPGPSRRPGPCACACLLSAPRRADAASEGGSTVLPYFCPEPYYPA